MRKAELFKEMGWSQELIDHFTIVDEAENIPSSIKDEPVEMFESTTTTIKHQTSNNQTNINIQRSRV